MKLTLFNPSFGRAAWLIGAWLLAANVYAAAAKPNIVFILADDMGYGDLGCYGNAEARTPNLDRMAKQGVRFTQYYANGAECTPTRTAFLTGRYQHRVGGLECAIGNGHMGRYDDAIRLRGRNELGLPTSEVSLARLLKNAGYATAITGKWHLGYDPKFSPLRHGFDYFFGNLGGSIDYYYHVEAELQDVLMLNDKPTRREGYTTDLYTAEAVQFIARSKGKPFFLYVPYTAPHSPYQPPGEKPAKPAGDEEANQGKHADYLAMVERLDVGVGEILKALDAAGVAENTLVIFASDNGGTKMSRNVPYSGNKGTVYEGGLRVPCIARWPGRITAGTESDRLCLTMDLTASLVQAGAARLPAGRNLDGIDILGELTANRAATERAVFWRARRGAVTWKAAREGSLKYIFHRAGERVNEYLFDLAADPAEKQNLLAAKGEDANRLKEKLTAWEEAVRPVR